MTDTYDILFASLRYAVILAVPAMLVITLSLNVFFSGRPASSLTLSIYTISYLALTCVVFSAITLGYQLMIPGVIKDVYQNDLLIAFGVVTALFFIVVKKRATSLDTINNAILLPSYSGPAFSGEVKVRFDKTYHGFYLLHHFDRVVSPINGRELSDTYAIGLTDKDITPGTVTFVRQAKTLRGYIVKTWNYQIKVNGDWVPIRVEA